jgi:hypothetical protein
MYSFCFCWLLNCKNAGSQSGNGALTWLTIEEAGKLGAKDQTMTKSF